MFTVTVSTPGDLPEAEPIECDDITEARQAIAEEIDRDWDSAYENCDDASERDAVDAVFLDAYAAVNSMNAPESVECYGLVYEIHSE